MTQSRERSWTAAQIAMGAALLGASPSRRRSPPRRSSGRLINLLPLIAAELLDPEAYREKTSTLGFYGDGCLPPAPLPSLLTDRELMAELGEALKAICLGHDAKKVFRQDERTKPQTINAHSIALTYWYFYARSGRLNDDSEALQAVRSKSNVPTRYKDETIRRLARKGRDSAFETLIGTGATIHDLMFVSSGDKNKSAFLRHSAGWEEKLQRLREHLRRKNPRPL
jgi:hypothetical protein